MSAINEQQLKTASPFMGEFWKDFLKLYYNPDDTDEYWKEVVDKTNALAEKYCNDDPVLLWVLLGAQRGLEDKAKGQTASKHKYVLSDDIVDALNDMNKAMEQLKTAYGKAHKVELVNSSVAAATMVKGKD